MSVSLEPDFFSKAKDILLFWSKTQVSYFCDTSNMKFGWNWMKKERKSSFFHIPNGCCRTPVCSLTRAVCAYMYRGLEDICDLSGGNSTREHTPPGNRGKGLLTELLAAVSSLLLPVGLWAVLARRISIYREVKPLWKICTLQIIKINWFK